MIAATLSSPAGTAKALLSGGWLVDLGDMPPQVVTDRATARAALGIPDSPAGPDGLWSSSNAARSGPNFIDP